MPHCVVFVFDGSSEPFLEPESLEFFQTVFNDCSKMGEFCSPVFILLEYE